MFSLLRSALFALPPETSHHLALGGMKTLNALGYQRQQPRKPVRAFGIDFPNPVGLAAGLDKNADYIDGLAALGFGYIEVGTITPRPQPGNPQPRLFRIPERQAIINRMGFNNAGVDHLVRQVERANYRGVLGINIGKNKDTPAENAADDYLHCMERVYPLASYITVNLSSPNTPGLRDLQFGEPLERLLGALAERREQLAGQHGRHVPMLVKIAPDMADDDIGNVADAFVRHGMDGVIATNTTISREGVEGLRHADEAGGLSGAPVREKSTHALKVLCDHLAGRLPVIGVGGITEGAHAAEKQAAGASLVQVYSGFIYRGPALIDEAVAAWRG